MNIVTALFTRAIALKASQRDGDGDGLINDGTSQEMPSSVYADRLQKLRQRRGEDRNGVSLAVTETPEFKRWFGDSKVVDENGKPLVVYHGTTAEQKSFDHAATTGVYFTQDPQYANHYTQDGTGTLERNGGNAQVMPVYLQVKNPKYFGVGWDKTGKFDSTQTDKNFRLLTPEVIQKYKEQGYDALILRVPRDKSGLLTSGFTMREIVVFDARQIKSATGNNGQFDPRSADISKSLSIGKG